MNRGAFLKGSTVFLLCAILLNALPAAADFPSELAQLLNIAGSPNRRPASLLTLETASIEEAEGLAQRAAALAAAHGWRVIEHHVEPTPEGGRRLTMRFGPDDSPRVTLLLDWGAPRWSGPRLAVIIDDCGARDPRRGLLLELPVTPAVLPFLAYSAEVVRAARERGRPVMLHLPCEARGGEHPGPGGLYVTMSDDELRRRLISALDNVGEVDGVNNHMGSRLTADRRAMGVVLGELQRRGLYFIDSYTHHSSVVLEVASGLGLPAGRRDIFLDNSNNPAHVEAMFRQALELALATNGPVIAIGHDRDGTLEVIRRLLPLAAELGVALVPPQACLTP